jgi:Tfp pilus assembly protein PilV
MPHFFAKRWFICRSSIGRVRARQAHPFAGTSPRAPSQPRGSEDGFLLIEVMVSAVLVGLIVIATLTGFDVVGRSSAEQRRHNVAAVLASQSQEQLRSDPASTLLSFKNSEHTYTTTVGGTLFAVAQKASFGNGGTQTGCSATEEGAKGKGTYILVSTSVTWSHMVGKPVTASSLITPPIGSALEVEVNDGGSTPTAGVKILVSYTAVEATGTTTLQATTGSAGCVLFAGIPATKAVMRVEESPGIVNKAGTLSWPEEEVTLAPNVLTTHEVVLAPGGALQAEFDYENSATYKHKQNNPASAEITEEVKGDTFVASNVEMGVLPNFQTGSNQDLQNFPGQLFELLPGAAGTYEHKANTQKEPLEYPQGNLFPFPPEKTWSVYAGDCTANSPEALTSGTTKLKNAKLLVSPGATTSVVVPMTYVQLNVYSKSQALIEAAKTEAYKSLESTNSYPVTITNTKCAGVTPDNETTLNVKHVQNTTTGPVWGGHLEDPFQPFGEYELCLYAAGKTYTFAKPYSNLVPATKTVRNVYLGEASHAEKEATRTAKEAETKKARETTEETTRKTAETKEEATQTKREGEEATARTKRETEETPGRVKREKEEKTEKETKEKEEATEEARETKEETERNTWKTEEKNKKISKSQREAKEATQTTNRKAAEKTEKTAHEKREKEEATTKTVRTTEETKRKSAEATEETKRKSAEATEKTTETTRLSSESTTKKSAETTEASAKKTAETAETAELAAKEDTIESGKTSC